MAVNILFDIDETLVINEKYISITRNIVEIIKELKKNGYIFGICTNRPLEPYVKKIVKKFKIDGFIICEGGLAVYRKKFNKYILKNKTESINKKIIKNINESFILNERLKFNKYRKFSSSIKYDNLTDRLVRNLKYLLEEIIDTKKYQLINLNKKIIIQNTNIDKIKTINNLYKDKTIFITDYELDITTPNKNVLIYSVGENDDFNKKCNKKFKPGPVGVLEILKKEKRNIK